MSATPRSNPNDSRATPAAAQSEGYTAADVEMLVNVPPGERQNAALRLHDVLIRMRRDGNAGTLRDLQISETLLAALLNDSSDIVRSVAAMLAGHTGDSRCVALLARMVREDEDSFARIRAVEALGYLGAVSALPLILEVAHDPSHPAYRHAIRALGRLGPTADADLGRLALEHEDEAIRRVAAETIARMASSPAWTRFLQMFANEPRPEIRQSVIEGFGRSRASRAAPPIVGALVSDPMPAVRQTCAEALVMLGDTRTVGALYESALYDSFFVWTVSDLAAGPLEADKALGTRSYPVRVASARALATLGGERVWQELAAPIDDLVALPGGGRG
jgi:HEAT repeat protein